MNVVAQPAGVRSRLTHNITRQTHEREGELQPRYVFIERQTPESIVSQKFLHSSGDEDTRLGEDAKVRLDRISAAATVRIVDAATSRHRVLPLPQQLATRTPQRRTRKLSPSERAGPAISYFVHDASRSSEPVGGSDKGWLAEEVEKLPPRIVAPGNRQSPTVGTVTK